MHTQTCKHELRQEMVHEHGEVSRRAASKDGREKGWMYSYEDSLLNRCGGFQS